MIATWPTSLPRPERDNWWLQPQDARRKRQNDAGPPGYRRRFSSVAKSVSMSLLLSQNQRETFDQFFHKTCQEGAISFWMSDPTRDGWPLTTASGVPLWVACSVPRIFAPAIALGRVNHVPQTRSRSTISAAC
ncbi:MAG: hypothetical protein QM682_17740 [Paracoccus sp. (in: a-proteobacteria)]|uniref:hypothetical protein n=1 Tax=Paracoccus sp. TaxID=267 RepID=UPI0039E4E204